MNFRLDIQGLRALAVILVIIFHINEKWLPGGFVGVDMFFVISGYLISKALIKQTDLKAFSYSVFILNRIKRIVPAYFVMCLVSIVVVIYLFIPSDVLTFLYHLRRGVFFTTNQVFATATDYFGAKSFENPLLHTWSLSIEMQFYLFLPFLFMLFSKNKYKIILLIGTIILLIYTQFQLQDELNKQSIYFSTTARIAEFATGIFLNFMPTSQNSSKKTKTALSLLSVMILLLSFIFINEQSIFPGFLALPACIATALLIWVEDTKVNSILSSKFFVFIGTISYSLYLWHWPILAFYRYYYGDYNIAPLSIFFLIVIIFLISIFSYYFIEEFFRKVKNKWLSLGLGVLTIALLTGWFLARKHFQSIQDFEAKYTSVNGYEIDKILSREYFLLGKQKEEDDHILVIGDSHATVMSGFLDKVGKQNNFNFSTLSINSVVPLEGIPDSLVPQPYKKEYNESVPIANQWISKSKIIIVVKHWYSDSYGFASVLQKLVKKINKDQHIILVSDFPILPSNPVRIFRSVLQPNDFKPLTIKFPKMPNGVQQIINENRNVHYVNLRNETFFKNAPFYNDTLMYYDEGHLNHYGSVQFAKYEGYKLSNLIQKLKNNK